ncbi:hypothetical protein [Nisaea sediminum]|uniref:hypothetical protein n=1 Tax=Nisaea sediminum TaxID=2775867 RepID=UPI0018684C50|nr:hypothetical protein [Nisaea sediminum]
MPRSWPLTALILLSVAGGCADPEAAARIEVRRQNVLAALHAARDIFCALPPEARRQLRAAGKLDPDIDNCASAPEETAP